MKKSGRVFSSWGLSEEYPFCDADGRRPHFGRHFEKAYGFKVISCDDGFYKYWFDDVIDRVFGEWRSEEHTSELQSLTNLVCRLLLEKKKTRQRKNVQC